MQRKGIILAGGTGTRLYPSTISVSKQLMPVYDKPMIYYPLSVLMQAGIRDILIITTPQDQSAFQTLLKDGAQWGLSISYEVQARPEGIAQALLIAENFLNGAPCALILGDNLFFGQGFNQTVRTSIGKNNGAIIFGYQVKDPSAYGVIGFDENKSVISLVEKPTEPASEYAITGLYFYDGNASKYASEITPSKRGELEITALNQIYLERGELDVEFLASDTTWLDTGTHRSLFQAAQFVSVIEERQGLRICCPEVIAFQNEWIDALALALLATAMGQSSYGKYLSRVAQGGIGGDGSVPA